MKTVRIGLSRRTGRAMVVGLVAASRLAACSSDADSSTSDGESSSTATGAPSTDAPSTEAPAKQGGTIVIGAEQEPAADLGDDVRRLDIELGQVHGADARR